MITLRRIKGSPLTYDEVDDNFVDLDTRIITADSVLGVVENDITFLQSEIGRLDSNDVLINNDIDTLDQLKIAKSYETLSKNLPASNATLNYTSGNLTSINYAGGVTKTLNYTDGTLSSVVLSGTSGVQTTKTFAYNGQNDLIGVTYA